MCGCVGVVDRRLINLLGKDVGFGGWVISLGIRLHFLFPKSHTHKLRHHLTPPTRTPHQHPATGAKEKDIELRVRGEASNGQEEARTILLRARRRGVLHPEVLYGASGVVSAV